MIKLDRETYRDTPNLPSVTEILKNAELIDANLHTEEPRQRGAAVHLACEYWDQGDLDEGSIDTAVAGYLQSYIKFRQARAAEIRWIEIPMMDKCGVYAGTPDEKRRGRKGEIAGWEGRIIWNL